MERGLIALPKVTQISEVTDINLLSAIAKDLIDKEMDDILIDSD